MAPPSCKRQQQPTRAQDIQSPVWLWCFPISHLNPPSYLSNNTNVWWLLSRRSKPACHFPPPTSIKPIRVVCYAFFAEEDGKGRIRAVAYSLHAASAMLMEDVWMCLLPILIVQALLDITFIEGQHCCFPIWRQSGLASHEAWACGWWIWTSIDDRASSGQSGHMDETPLEKDWMMEKDSAYPAQYRHIGQTSLTLHKAGWPTWLLRHTEEWALEFEDV